METPQFLPLPTSSRFTDLTGQKIGMLTVIGLEKISPRARWFVRCDCGETKSINGSSLINGHSSSCGCQARQAKTNHQLDMVGNVYGRLRVIRETDPRYINTPKGPMKQRMWECGCECGGKIAAYQNALRRGFTRSCGCLRREVITQIKTKHGMCYSSIYNTWWNIIGRCENPNDGAFHNYGGRGITICEGWRDSFDAFYADMGERPRDDLSIDRKDNDGGYWCGHCEECRQLERPANCRWATRQEQQANKRPRKRHK